MNLLGISPLIKYSLSLVVQANALFFQKSETELSLSINFRICFGNKMATFLTSPDLIAFLKAELSNSLLEKYMTNFTFINEAESSSQRYIIRKFYHKMPQKRVHISFEASYSSYRQLLLSLTNTSNPLEPSCSRGLFIGRCIKGLLYSL
jgi:hypothetical protein